MSLRFCESVLIEKISFNFRDSNFSIARTSPFLIPLPLTAFLDLQNVFDRDNEWQRVYYDDGTYEMSYQYKQLPVAGMIIEF